MFFPPRSDKFVWDVSHQSYVHKILTGRKDRFHTIRTTGGLNGFSLRTESQHDCYGAGHAGTALSAALGMCAARDQRKSDENVVCIFGDAALTNGISFEALNNIAHTTKRFIGVLNDNEWSIAKNVGAISSHLNKVITHPHYNRVQKDLERWVKRMPKGELAIKLGHKAEEILKSVLAGASLEQNREQPEADGRGGYGNSLIFEEMGLRYLGPIDGHNLPLLISSLEFAKASELPVRSACPDQKRQRLRSRLELSGKISRPGALRPGHRQHAAGQAGHAAELPGRFRADHGQALSKR